MMDVLELSPEAAAERATEIIQAWSSGAEHTTLIEALASIDRALRLEDENWEHLYGATDSNTGFDLDQLLEISQSVRYAIAKSPIVKRALRLRTSYTWSKGLNLPDTEPAPETDEDGKPKRGRKPAEHREKELAHARVTNPINQSNVFGDAAHEELESLAFADGQAFLLGDNRTREIRRIPLCDITGVVTHPDHPDEVWAFKRSWNSIDPSGRAKGMQRWYYLDTYTGTKRTQIKNTTVDQTKTLLWQPFNRIGNWPLGIPDAVNVIAWAKLYSEFLKHGYVMSKALATFAFKATVPSKKSGENATLKLASATGAGQSAVVPGAGDLTAMPTAGKGYDFASGRALAAMVATGVEVSLIHLLSDPGAAGSSYGSASNLDLPTKRAIVSRQKLWAAFFKRILAYLGVPDAKVDFPTLEDPDFYRETQSLILGWSTGTLKPEEVRARLISLLNVGPMDMDVPDDILVPNTKGSFTATNPTPDAADGKTPKQAAAGGQGKSKGTGKDSSAGNDIRNDGLERMLSMQQNEELLRAVRDLQAMIADIRPQQ
jgi:hypothetical protein